MVNDTIGDLLTRIRNTSILKTETAAVPLTRINKKIIEIFEKEGFIESFQNYPLPVLEVEPKPKDNETSGLIIVYLKYTGPEKKPCITGLKRISKPGLRVYANYKEIPKVLGGMGIAILSTSKGIMTDREARFRKIGGEILCAVW